MARDEVARLAYIDWQDVYDVEKPYQIFSTLSSDLSDLSSTNLVFKDGELEDMHDVRGRESDFVLDKQGFQFCKHKLNVLDLISPKAVEEAYLPQMEVLLRQTLGDVCIASSSLIGG